MTVKEENKTKKEEKSSQDLAESSIYKEERVLRMMEEKDILAGPGKIYSFTQANMDDLVTRTGLF